MMYVEDNYGIEQPIYYALMKQETKTSLFH